MRRRENYCSTQKLTNCLHSLVGRGHTEVNKLFALIGPLLFLIFINDLPVDLTSDILLFADDLKIIANALNANASSDLTYLEEWESLWLLPFNPEKCSVVHLSANNNPFCSYQLNGVVLHEYETERDMGVMMTNSFSWHSEIDQCIAKANQKISWIARNIISRESSVMLSIYKSLVRPLLEVKFGTLCLNMATGQLFLKSKVHTKEIYEDDRWNWPIYSRTHYPWRSAM